MDLAVVSINHNITPIEIREKFSFTESLKIKAGDYLLDRTIEEFIIISTCNRTEIYIASEDIEKSIEETIDMLEDIFQVKNTRDYLMILKNREAVIHIFLVAAGLDSVVLGEDQILGQVVDAMETAIELGFSRKILNRLFMEAINAGKRVRSEIRISEIPLSTSYIGIRMLKEKMGSMEGKTAFIIGAGEISKLAFNYLEEENLEKIYLTNRTHGRLTEIYNIEEDTETVLYEDRYDILDEVDIMISATASPHAVIKNESFKDREKPIYILDLGLPRDIEGEISNRDLVELIGLDDLNTVSEENQEKREELAKEAMGIIDEEVEEFLHWMEHTKVDPILKSLNIRVDEIKNSRMEYLDRRIDWVSERDRILIESTLDSALKALIRDPINTLKDLHGKKVDKYMETANHLFGLDE